MNEKRYKCTTHAARRSIQPWCWTVSILPNLLTLTQQASKERWVLKLTILESSTDLETCQWQSEQKEIQNLDIIEVQKEVWIFGHCCAARNVHTGSCFKFNKERGIDVPSFLPTTSLTLLNSKMIRGNLNGNVDNFGNGNSGIIGDGNNVVSTQPWYTLPVVETPSLPVKCYHPCILIDERRISWGFRIWVWYVKFQVC